MPTETVQTTEDQSKVVESALPNTVEPESTDSSVRYAAYATRLRTILLASHRYVAYTSDIGESFRPVAHPYLVKMCYGISWSYILGDVAYEGWKAKLRSEGRLTKGLRPWDPIPEPNPLALKMNSNDLDYRLVMLKRGLFQSIASMGLPAFTIHSSVRYGSYFFKNFKNHRIRTYGPVGLGLAIVPALPYLFDEPVEHVMDAIFDKLH